MSSDKTIRIQIDSGKPSTTGGGRGKSPEKKTTEELASLSIAREKQREDIKKTVAEQKKYEDSLKGLKAQLYLLEQEYNNMNGITGKNKEAHKQLADQLKMVRERLKQAEQAGGDFRRKST